jgi:hypothetical protein
VVVDELPDVQERNRAAIEMVVHDDVGPVSIEHTLIEAYPGQIHENRRMAEIFDGFAQRFGNSLPHPGRYTLCVHPGGARDLPRRLTGNAVEAFECWVRAQNLPEPTLPVREPNHVVGNPPDVPFAATLFRMLCDAADDGTLGVAYLGEEGREAGRVTRVKDALRRKCPKLEAGRRSGGLTLLVLESNDFVMTNPWFVAQAINGAASSLDVSVPDVIVHIDTSAGTSWIPYVVKVKDWWSRVAEGER